MEISGSKPKLILPEKEKGNIRDFQELINAINSKALSSETAEKVQNKVNHLNAWEGSSKSFVKELKKVKKRGFGDPSEKQKLVPEKYYATLWMPLGMSVFGLPIRVAISALTGKISFIGIGLPLGMAIGSFYGVYLDKKAEK
ncbi:hypothetical protein SAMN04488034_10816 [Salinimicrobium catena]|uniref:Uncharacterized protein n=1 Tax=Salinimicrobium catena TaxID=390640 RepID=A0A1H5P1R6_9FLAO|nr:hypothetical protein [Salinimicrobium catena]SDL68976.1 hypothetical protein SAMN04488140_10880 [Salinimicrobium catena]SEF07863.1 hypothetical protein SAMN04488034_10816 [Salinimicrobium catena]